MLPQARGPARARQKAWLAAGMLLLLAVPPAQAGPPSRQEGVGPGARIVEPAPCTMGFVLQDLSALPALRYGALVAAHCVDEAGQRVVVRTPSGRELDVGHVGFLVPPPRPHDRDVAIVLVDDAVAPLVNVEVPLVGGPCGAEPAGAGDEVWFLGHGHPLFKARDATAKNATAWFTWPWSLALPGDSGGPVLVERGAARRAAGLVAETAFQVWPPHVTPGQAPLVGVTHARGPDVGTALALVRGELGQGWDVVPAPSC